VAGHLLWGLLSLYAVTVLAGAAHRLRRDGVRAWLQTAAAFVIIHVAWGTGFLAGLLRHGDRWRRAEPVPPALEPTMALRTEQ
jgi:hypothetical protein